jgi:protein-tyrosine kinase
MSRIHEALKRAKLERSAAQDADVAPMAHGVGTAAGTALANPPAADEILTAERLAPPAPTMELPLRFEDLVGRCARPDWNPDPGVNVFEPSLGTSGAEQFRTLRSRLYQLRSNQPLRTVLVTSSMAAEGKTFVVSNLARAIVRQPDRRALVIDADLRRSRLHIPFGAPSAPGLTDFLRGNASEFEVLQMGPEGNLFLLPGGSTASNPSELLANGRLKDLLLRVARVFDWILIDSPPCLPVADANVVAELCDAVLLVVRAGATPAAMVQRAHRELQDRKVAGVVLNSVDEDSFGYTAYYAYGGYGEDKGDSNHQGGPAT